MRSRRETWIKRVAEWRRSGRTANEYADAIGVNAGTLSHWAWRLGHERRGGQGELGPAMVAAPAAVIEVVSKSGGADNGFALELASGRRLHIPSGFDALALGRLLDVLEGRR